MLTVNMFEAKSNLSKLVESVESGVEKEIIIARNGKPAARLVPLSEEPKGQRLGVAKGKFVSPDNIDAMDAEIEELFYGSSK